MKRLIFILPLTLIVIFTGCQQSQEKNTAEVSRKDRLVGNENLSLRNELKICQEEIEKQKSLVLQCQKEKEKADEQCGETTTWLLKDLPKDLIEDSTKLSQENANLLSRIADLESELAKYKSQQQSPTPQQQQQAK